MYLMTATRNGVAAKELQRQLGVTYKCAWRIGHQLRLLMAARDEATNPGPLSGHVEVDDVHRRKDRRSKARGFQTRPSLWAWSSVAACSRAKSSKPSSQLFPVILRRRGRPLINTDT